MKLQKALLYMVLVLGFVLTGCANQNPGETTSETQPETTAVDQETVQDYFPIQNNVELVYEGSGNEYASYTVFFDFTAENKLQRRVNNGGTEQVEVIQIADGKATRLFHQAEVYYRANFLDQPANEQDVLLMEPIAVGTSWTASNGATRTITDVAAAVSTPRGQYTAVCVETTNEFGTTTDYYAKNVGLVKTVYLSDNYEVSSSLSEIRENEPLVQTVRFFYPNGNDSKIYYKDQQIAFETNDEATVLLAAAYKADFTGKPGNVLSQNTKINSCTVSPDGIVHIDLSKEFLTEMSAGSGYELLMLQCIANTFGSYYQQNEVALTIDNALYSSGHIAFGQGETLSVNLDDCVELS